MALVLRLKVSNVGLEVVLVLEVIDGVPAVSTLDPEDIVIDKLLVSDVAVDKLLVVALVEINVDVTIT